MRTGPRLAAYGAALAIVLGGGAAVGAAAGPVDVGGDEAHDPHATAGGAPTVVPDPASDTAPAAAATPAGLAVAQGGYRLVAAADTLEAGRPSDFAFSIVDDAGQPVTDFEPEHERDLHLIVVGRDLRGYAHLHPTLGPDGTWSVEVPALEPGSYRAFADFRPAGAEALTLGTDLTVPGAPADLSPPRPADRATVGGYQVALEGEPSVGEAELALAVQRDGEPVRTDPYLGAAGHLVAIRDGDLAYLHVHPLDAGDGEGGDEVRFAVEFPSAGTYRLFFDFSHGGRVRTAAFTVVVDGPTADAHDPTEGH